MGTPFLVQPGHVLLRSPLFHSFIPSSLWFQIWRAVVRKGCPHPYLSTAWTCRGCCKKGGVLGVKEGCRYPCLRASKPPSLQQPGHIQAVLRKGCGHPFLTTTPKILVGLFAVLLCLSTELRHTEIRRISAHMMVMHSTHSNNNNNASSNHYSHTAQIQQQQQQQKRQPQKQGANAIVEGFHDTKQMAQFDINIVCFCGHLAQLILYV